MPNARILVVEDEYIVAMDISSRLESMGYSVVDTIASGEQAIAIAAETTPDLVLMDVKLEGAMDGITAAEKIQSSRDIPVVFLTAFSEQNTLQRAKSAEPYGYILKPFQERELYANIEIALHKSRLERELKEKEERLNLAIQGTKGGVWDIEFQQEVPSGTFEHNIYLSEEIRQIINLPSSAANGKVSDYLDYIHPTDLQKLLSSFKEHSAGSDEQFSAEFRAIVQSEVIGWYALNAKTHRNEDGHIIRMTGVLWDVTEKQQSLNRLERVNRLLGAIRNVNRLIVREKDPLRLIDSACENMVETMGYHSAWIGLVDPTPAAEFLDAPVSMAFRNIAQYNLGDGFNDFLHHLEQARLYPCVTGALQTDNVVTVIEFGEMCQDCPLHATCTDGAVLGIRLEYEKTIYGILNVTIPSEYNGDAEELELFREMAGDIGFAMYDINLKKQHELANQKADKAKAQLEFVTDNLPILLAYADKDGRFILANEYCETFFGASKDEIVGKSIQDLPNQRISDIFRMQTQQITNGSVVKSIETLYSREDNKDHHFAFSFIPETKRNGGYIILGQDITDRLEIEADWEKLQNQLMQSQKMEALGTLAGGIAHDFNNMLTPLLGFAEISLKENADNIRLRENLGYVVNSGRRARDLVQQILSFSQRSERAHKSLDMKEVLDEALKLVRASLPATIEIQTDITSAPAVIMGDFTQMHQVVVNLCANAKHALRENGGKLHVELHRETFENNTQSGDAEESLKLIIADTGHGMSEEVKSRIFEPYFTTKNKGEGSGLGLSVVHGIVQEHGGDITVQSAVGEGTTFTIELPAIPKATKASEEEFVPDAIPHGTGSILIVDDESYVVDWQKQALEVLGYTITGHTDPLEALTVFKENPQEFDLVISDVTMPNLPGDELSKAIKSIRPDIPVILATGFSERVNAGNIEDYQADQYMTKPINWQELAVAVDNLLMNNGM